jgi:hypothetical protein
MQSRALIWINLGLAMVGCSDDVLRPVVPSSERAGTVSPSVAVVRGSPARVENIVELGTGPDDDAVVVDVNRFGVAIGVTLDDDADERPVVWTDGQPRELAIPTGWSTGFNTGEPAAINNQGQIVGNGNGPTGTRALLWSADSEDVVVLTSPAGSSEEFALDINESGEIVGRGFIDSRPQAVLWRSGIPTLLPPASGHVGGVAQHISDAGLILGRSHPDDVALQLAVWDGDELAWVDEPKTIEPVLFGWNGITDGGLAYISDNIAGDTIYVWDDGEIQAIEDGGAALHVDDVSPDGLFVGALGGTYGVWTEDRIFHPWDNTQVDRCTAIAEDRWVACVYQDVWFVAQLTFDGSGGGGDRVNDLRATTQTPTTVTLSWTQVDDGTGAPASYRVKYATPPIDWRTATIGCSRTMRGTAIGASMACTVEGLDERTAYEFQLMSFRTVDGVWVDAKSSNVAAASTTGDAGAIKVTDLSVTGVSSSSITVRWTQIDDGTGHPARYRVKYALPPISYPTAIRACTIRGEEIGAELSCTIDDLDPGTTYDVQLMSYRLEDGVWADAEESNVVTATTEGSAGKDEVDDLRVVSSSFSSGTAQVRLEWTEIDDGTGNPASYRLRYGAPLDDWKTGTIGCERTITGTQVGSPMACTVTGLAPGVRYDFQLMSFRVEEGAWANARFSNRTSATTPTS